MDQPLLPLSSLSLARPSGHDVRSRRFVHASFPHLVVFDGGLFFVFLHALVPVLPSDRRHVSSATTTHLRSILFVLRRIRAVDRRRLIRRRTLSFLRQPLLSRLLPSSSSFLAFRPHLRRPRTLPWRRQLLPRRRRRRRMRHHRCRRGIHHDWTWVSPTHVEDTTSMAKEEERRGRQTWTASKHMRGLGCARGGERRRKRRTSKVDASRKRERACARVGEKPARGGRGVAAGDGGEVVMVRPKRGG